MLETIAQGWASGLKVRIAHQGLRSREPLTYTVSPYLIEPALWGDGTYLIGFSDRHNAVATFKVERIEHAALTDEPFSVPENFDERALLEHTWGIWYGEGEPATVRLRFAPGQVTRRVKESIWHPSQEIVDDQDGGCSWTAHVAEWRELVPWVRGWGADVEVLEPEGLRAELVREARRLSGLYGVVAKKIDLLAHIRKSDRETQALEEHLRQVSRLAGQFANKIGLQKTGEVLGLLHDLGKASAEFQNYLLSAEGFKNPDADGYVDPIAMRGKIDHSTAGAQLIWETLWAKGARERAAAQVLGLCVASHHSGLIDCLSPNGDDNFRRRMGKSGESTRKAEAIANLPEISSTVESVLLGGAVDQIYAKLEALQSGTGSESRTTLMFKAGLLIRYLLSCVLDADRLDTSDFESPDNRRSRNYGNYRPWSVLVDRLEGRFARLRGENRICRP